MRALRQVVRQRKHGVPVMGRVWALIGLALLGKAAMAAGPHCDEAKEKAAAAAARCDAAARQCQRNTRSNRLLTFNGQTKCLMDWALSLGVKFNTLHERLRRGWSVERTLTTSIQGRQ